LNIQRPFVLISRACAAVTRELREALYRAHISRASSGETDNTPLIERTLALRREQAQLLGYANYAEVSMASKARPAPCRAPARRRARVRNLPERFCNIRHLLLLPKSPLLSLLMWRLVYGCMHACFTS
jgi:hypothetical protein